MFIAMIWYCSNLDYRHTLGKDTHESKPHGTPNTRPFPDTHTSTLRGSVPRSTFTVLPNINPVKSDVKIVPFIDNPVSLLLGTDPNHFILGWIKCQIKCVIHRAKVCHCNNTVVLWQVFTFCITLDGVTIVAQLFPNDNLPLIDIFQTHPFCLTMLNSNHTDTLNTQWHHLDRIWALSNTSVIVIILWPLFYHTSYGDTHDERAHTHTHSRSIIHAAPITEWVSLTPEPRLMWAHRGADWSVEKSSLHCLSDIWNVEKGWVAWARQLDSRPCFKSW